MSGSIERQSHLATSATSGEDVNLAIVLASVGSLLTTPPAEYAIAIAKALQAVLGSSAHDSEQPRTPCAALIDQLPGADVEFQLLGPLRVVNAGEVVRVGSARQRAVLALLLVRAPELVSLDQLVDGLWGEQPPATAAHAIHVYVSGIRKALRAVNLEGAVRRCGCGYMLDVDPERIDARRFERLVGTAARVAGHDPVVARGLLETALTSWRGVPLGEFADLEWARREAGRLVELREGAVEALAEATLVSGEHAQAITVLSRLVADSPLRERARRLLMLALYRSGRAADALASYRDACGSLREIGLRPGPQLRALEQAILQHDPTLTATALPISVGNARDY